MAVETARPTYEIVGPLVRFDERDHVMARERLVPDSPQWKAYFALRPELEERARKLKKLPGLRGTGDPVDLAMLDTIQFGLVRTLSSEEDVCPRPAEQRREIEPARASTKLKGLARLLGADLVRIGPLNPAWVYSHVGRSHQPERLG